MEVTGLTRLPWRPCGMSEEGGARPSEGHGGDSQLNLIVL